MKPLHNRYFINFIVYFNENQDFFEGHEVLEEYWNSFQHRNKEHPLIGYILLSTGMYHWRRGNLVGGKRTLRKALKKLLKTEIEYPNFTDGIDFKELLICIDTALQHIENNEPFYSFPIHILSEDIFSLVETIKPQMKLLPLGSDDLIHKHMLRDRSSILQARNEKLDEKKKGRGY